MRWDDVFLRCVLPETTFNSTGRVSVSDKKPVRNGSQRMMVGDNIYNYDSTHKEWHQADSHHSNPDGSVNPHNLFTDTKTDKVLISRHFFYFGREAPPFRVIFWTRLDSRTEETIESLTLIIVPASSIGCTTHLRDSLNHVKADPFDLMKVRGAIHQVIIKSHRSRFLI